MKKLLVQSISASLLMMGMAANAADHKDAVGVDTRISGDITDAYAFVDPANPDNVILAMSVNPFTNPNENPGVHVEENYLYQIKIDNDQSNGALEDLVVQFEFTADPNRQKQPYAVKLGVPDPANRGPNNNVRLSDSTIICEGADSFFGGVNDQPVDGFATDGQISCFSGLTDDPFQTDVAQYVFRIGLDPDEATNANAQDVPRFALSALFGELRGRPLRLDDLGAVNSGVDGFGGFNVSTMAVSVPKELLRGSGIPDATQDGAVNSSLIGAWATVSRQATELYDGFTPSGMEEGSEDFNQFERMGQQLFATVFVHDGIPFNSTPSAIAAGLSDGAQRDLYNATGPENDAENWDFLVFDSLLSEGLLGGLLPLNFNTVEGRATLLTAGGFTAPATGTPLLAPSLASDSPLGKRKRALAELLLPDYMRLHLDLTPDAVRPGAAAYGNSDPVFGIARWGVQNGRRPQDDVTDIYVRLAREFADVKFPDDLVIDGLGLSTFPGSGPLGDRRAINCTSLEVELISGLLGLLRAPSLGEVTLLDNCDDSRIFAVLQGTDWTEPTQIQVNNLANQSQLTNFNSSFPYFPVAHPIPGEAGTVGFPHQHEDDVL